MQLTKYSLLIALASTTQFVSAEILPTAEIGIKIPIVKKPSTQPQTIAYSPNLKHYYVADGGLAPMGSEFEAPISKSEVHAYSASGEYVNSAKPGYDNRSIYYNPNTQKLETITYNVSSATGFFPNTGIFSLETSENGEIKNTSSEVIQFNPAFGGPATMPSYNPETKQYYAKQEHSNKVFIVDVSSREKVGEITLDLAKAQVKHDDIHENFIGYTGVKNEELSVIDVDHKAVLIFNLKGEYVGKSELPKSMKLRAKNHLNGTGYTNNMVFVYYETEGEFGTYYGFKVVN
jgi:hypothetical protein